jgi:hypothetical protein
MQRYREEFNKSPEADAYDHMVNRQLKSVREKDFDSRQKIKESVHLFMRKD